MFKIEYRSSNFVYSMKKDPVYCIDCAMFLYTEKQRSFGSYVSKEQKGCHKTLGKTKN